MTYIFGTKKNILSRRVLKPPTICKTSSIIICIPTCDHMEFLKYSNMSSYLLERASQFNILNNNLATDRLMDLT